MFMFVIDMRQILLRRHGLYIESNSRLALWVLCKFKGYISVRGSIDILTLLKRSSK